MWDGGAIMKTVKWKREPKGPGYYALHMFLDAGGERVELLVYDVAASNFCPRICGFEIFGRLRRNGPFHNQIGAGEADSLEAAMKAALTMASQPREMWAVLPRSWCRN
jgi:hypothetical protein